MSRRLLVNYFSHEKDILGATRTARKQGYEIVDVYTPYAVHGMDEAMGLKKSFLPWICFILGVLGAVAKLSFQIWTSATSWALNVGGKPFRSVPAFVPVTFEIMVLFAGVGTVLTFLFVGKLRPGKKPKIIYDGVTNDTFALVLVQNDAAFDIQLVKKMFEPFHLLSLEERIEKETN